MRTRYVLVSRDITWIGKMYAENKLHEEIEKEYGLLPVDCDQELKESTEIECSNTYEILELDTDEETESVENEKM